MRRRILIFITLLALAVAPLALAKAKPVKKITLSQTSMTLEKGISDELLVIFKPDGASAQVKWKSSDENVVVVDEGVVTAVGSGSATVTATTKNGKTAKCKISVPDPDKVVAITYDDGPVAGTLKLLDILRENDAKVTFFMVGENVDRNPDIAKAVADAGHEVGSHSVNHPNLQKLSFDKAKAQLTESYDSIESATGKRPTLMRAPYGAIDKDLAKRLNDVEPVTFVQWSVDTLDWKSKNADKVYDAVMKDIKPGCIILMHDIHSTTVDAAKKIFPALKKQGYTFVTVSELLEIRGAGDAAGTIVF